MSFRLSPSMRLSLNKDSAAEAKTMIEQCKLCKRSTVPEGSPAGCCGRCEKLLFEGCLEHVVAP